MSTPDTLMLDPRATPHGQAAGVPSLPPAVSASASVDVGSPGSPLPKVIKKRPYRVKPPKDSKIYKAVLACIALRAQGIPYSEITELLGLTKQTLFTYQKRAHAKGWLNIESFNDPEDQLEIVLKSKSVRNINTVLDERTDDGSLTSRASDVALEVAKGTGLLKQHQVVKTDAQSQMAVALKVQVEMPPMTSSQTLPAVRAGSIGGTPFFEGEIVPPAELES